MQNVHIVCRACILNRVISMIVCDCEHSRNQCALQVFAHWTPADSANKRECFYLHTEHLCLLYLYLIHSVVISRTLDWGSVNHFLCLLERLMRLKQTAGHCTQTASFQHHVCECIPLTLKGAVPPGMKQLLSFADVTRLAFLWKCFCVAGVLL